MGQVGKLRRLKTGWAHWCPACEEMHVFATDKPNSQGAQWRFNNDANHPTFEPSMHIKINNKDHPHHQPNAATTVCHYTLTAGILTYLMDCTHDMRGRKIYLPELPPGVRDP